MGDLLPARAGCICCSQSRASPNKKSATCSPFLRCLMADTQFYTQEAAFAKAADIQTALAASKLRLCKGPDFVPNQFTTRDTLIANECDFDGYTAGGYAIAAFSGPSNVGGGGAALTSPLLHPAYGPAGTPPVVNSVVAWWIEDGTAPTPQVRLVGIFDPARAEGAVGDIIDWVTQIVEGRNPVPA